MSGQLGRQPKLRGPRGAKGEVAAASHISPGGWRPKVDRQAASCWQATCPPPHRGCSGTGRTQDGGWRTRGGRCLLTSSCRLELPPMETEVSVVGCRPPHFPLLFLLPQQGVGPGRQGASAPLTAQPCAYCILQLAQRCEASQLMQGSAHALTNHCFCGEASSEPVLYRIICPQCTNWKHGSSAALPAHGG